MKVVRAALGAAVMASLLFSSVALAAGTPAGGKIKIFVANPDTLKTRVLVIGAIGDHGTAISQDTNGKPDINGTCEKFTLTQGGFTGAATGLNKLSARSDRRSTGIPARSSSLAAGLAR